MSLTPEFSYKFDWESFGNIQRVALCIAAYGILSLSFDRLSSTTSGIVHLFIKKSICCWVVR